VAVFDKGLFSFADVQHKSWPIIVVTNPKPLLTVQPCKEPVELMATSSHIRMFIFSPSPIQVCEVLQFNRLNLFRLSNILVCQQVKLDQGSWTPCILTGQNTPLYTVPWQPELYAKDLHVLEVRAKDSSGAEVSTEIYFALDDTKPHFTLGARIALMWDFTTMVSILSNKYNCCFITIFLIIFYYFDHLRVK
jgi:hypothetical protein